MNGSSFPTQTVGADRIRPQHKTPLRGACAGSTYSSTLQGVCVHPGACEKLGLRAAISRPYKAYAFIRVLPEIRDYGRLLWPPLQGVCVHPGTCGNPGLQADSIRPYRAYTLIRVLAKNRGCGRILSTHTTAAAELPQQIAYANVPQAKNRPSACAEGQLIFSEVTITKPCKQRKRHCRAEQHQQLPSGRLRPEPEWSTRLRPQHGTGRQRSCACQRSTA